MKLETFKPLFDRIVVKRTEAEEKTQTGLYVPTESKEKPIEGTVVAVGEGKPLDDGTFRKLRVEVGNRVLFNKYAGTEVKVEGHDYTVMREDDVLGVFVS